MADGFRFFSFFWERKKEHVIVDNQNFPPRCQATAREIELQGIYSFYSKQFIEATKWKPSHLQTSRTQDSGINTYLASKEGS